MNESCMDEIVRRITGSEKLTTIFGKWPSFHDAEVISLKLERWRSKNSPQPSLTLVLHTWKLTSEVDAQGYLVLKNSTRVTLSFTEIDEVELAGFNQQNAIFGLQLEWKSQGTNSSDVFLVTLNPAFGLSGQFECKGIEVIAATPFPLESDE